MVRPYHFHRCRICGSDSIHAKGLCIKHYNQMRIYGKIVDESPAKTKSTNPIRIYVDHAELDIVDRRGTDIQTYYLDVEDIEKVMQYKWCYMPSKHKKDRKIPFNPDKGMMTRFLLDYPEGQVRFIDKDHHNLRKDNLKVSYKAAPSLVDRLFHVYYSNKYKNYFIFIFKLGVSISCHSFDSLNEAIWFRNQLYKLLNIKDTKPEISRELISQLTEIQIQV